MEGLKSKGGNHDLLIPAMREEEKEKERRRERERERDLGALIMNYEYIFHK